LRRAGIAIEKECAFGDSGKSRYCGFVRLVGRDDRKNGARACQRLGGGRSAEHLRRCIIGSLRGPHFGNWGVGLDVIGANARLEVGVGAPASEKGLSSLAKAKKGDRART
jgi:hypothetical protein